MSKKILIELTAEEIQHILCVCTDSVAKRLREARDSKKHFSVVEWHKYPDEKPKRKGYYYIKFKGDPRVLSVLTYDGEFSFDVEYWAEPPKFPSED